MKINRLPCEDIPDDLNRIFSLTSLFLFSRSNMYIAHSSCFGASKSRLFTSQSARDLSSFFSPFNRFSLNIEEESFSAHLFDPFHTSRGEEENQIDRNYT